jgi:hypothetical protein
MWEQIRKPESHAKIRVLILGDKDPLTNTRRTIAAKQRNTPGKAGDTILAEEVLGALKE